MDKRSNRIFLIKLQLVKILFYPIIVIFDKLGIIKLFFKPLDSIVRFFGITRSINSFLKYRDFSEWFKNDFKAAKNLEEILLLPSFFGVSNNFTMLNLLFAKYYLIKGLKPALVVCNSTVSICQRENIIKSRKYNPFFCYECWDGYKSLSKATGIPVIYLTDLIDMSMQKQINTINNQITCLKTLKECEEFSFNNIPIGYYTKKSVLRYFLKGKLGGLSKEINIYKRFLKASVKLSVIYEKLICPESKINRVIINNGTLAFEKLLLYYCSKERIPFMTYETYMGDNTLIYKKNDEVMKFEWEKEYELFMKRNIPYFELESKVKGFFDELKIGKHKYGILNKKQNHNMIQDYGLFACAFTNLNFDTAVIGRHSIFDDMEDWLVSLIDFWEKNVEGIKLVIRIHPAEIKMRSGTKEFMGEKLKKIIKSEKIILIDSTETVNAYDLIDRMEYGLIYSSTIGLEIANMNKKCLIAGKPYFRNKPFVITPNNRQQYFEIISNINNNMFIFSYNKEELFRYTYFIFFSRLKYLKGLKVYTLNAEKSNNYKNSYEMLNSNLTFFDDFDSEFRDSTI